jgi:hypothetical protein
VNQRPRKALKSSKKKVEGVKAFQERRMSKTQAQGERTTCSAQDIERYGHRTFVSTYQ